MNSYAIRVTLPFNDCSGIVQRWFDRCTRAVCYEHEQDEDISRTHIHMALIGIDCKIEAIKRMWSDAPGKGNEFWSFSDLKDESKYLTYMTKGTLRPKLVKLFSHEQLENSRLAWVDPVKDDKQRKDPTEYYIDEVMSGYPKDKQGFIELYTHERFKMTTTVYHGPDVYVDWLFDDVRSRTMKVFWGENRRVPHATQYKIVAGSAFLRLCENYNLFVTGTEKLKNLWY